MLSMFGIKSKCLMSMYGTVSKAHAYGCARPQSRLTDVLHLRAGFQMCCTSEQACRCAAPQSRLSDVLHLRAGLQMCCT